MFGPQHKPISAPLPRRAMPWPQRLRASGESLATTAGVAALGALAVPRLKALCAVQVAPVVKHALMGASGTAGTLTCGFLLAAIVGTVVGQYPEECAVAPRGWAVLPAIAQGLALAPLAAQGAGVLLGPCGIVALSLTLGLVAALVPAGPDQGPLPLHNVGCAVIFAALLGPLGWDVAMGTHPVTAACRAVVVGALLVGIQAVMQTIWQLHLHYAPTPYAQKFLCDGRQVSQQRLDLSPKPMAEAPTIFGVTQTLRRIVDKLLEARGPLDAPFTGWHGVPVACLYGPAGTGKTLTAQGIAHALGAELCAVSSAELSVEAIAFAPVAGLNILTLIAQAELYGQRERKPVVVFIDEVDNFLPTSTQPARTHEDINRAINVALLHTTLTYLDDGKSHVMVVFATNHVQRIAPSLGLLTLRAPILLGAPTAKDLARVLENKCAQAHALHESLGILGPRLDRHTDILTMAEQMADAGLSGRDAEALVATGSDAVLAYAAHVLRAANRRDAARDAPNRALDEVFYTRLQRRLEVTLGHARKRGPRPPLPSLAPIVPRSVREFFRESGVHAADAEQLVRYAASAVAQGTTDPSQQLRMTQVGGRALRAAWQLLARAMMQRDAPSAAVKRHFTDVPRR